MFGLLVLSLIFVPIMCTRRTRKQPYKHLSTDAIMRDKSYQIESPEDIPDGDIDFFLITYAVDDRLYKISRQSVTVPQHIKVASQRYLLAQALAMDQLGNTRNVTECLSRYAGHAGTFRGHDLTLLQILQHHGIEDCVSVLTVSRKDCAIPFFEDAIVLLHTATTVTRVFL
jgi:hypothetical protein